MRSNFKALVVILVMPVMAVASGVTEAGEVPVAQTRNISVVSGNRVRFSMPAIGQEMLKNPSMMVVDIGHQKIGEEDWTLLLQCIQHRETATFQCSENDSSSPAITVGVWPTQTVLTIKNATHQHSGIYKMVFTYDSNLPREVEVNLVVTEAANSSSARDFPESKTPQKPSCIREADTKPNMAKMSKTFSVKELLTLVISLIGGWLVQ